MKTLEEELVRKQKEIDTLKEHNMLLLKTALKQQDKKIESEKKKN